MSVGRPASTSSWTRNLPGYEVFECLHDGPRSAVFRARQTSSGRRVVLKTTAAGHPTTESVRRLKSEYRLLRRVQSDRLIEPVALEYEGDHPILVTADVEASPPRLGTRLETSAVAQMGIQTAEALHALHGAGVVHRDLTLSNILQALSGDRIWVIDLGRATVAPAPSTRVEGTLGFVSPEQTGRIGRTVDYRTDYYALGVCLFALLTGRLPFVDGDPGALIYAHIATPPPDLVDLAPEVPPGLAAVVTRLLAKEPDRRFASAFEIAGALAPYANGAVPGIPFTSPPLSFCTRPHGRRHERRRLHRSHARAAAGARQLVVIRGEPGVGKSTSAGQWCATTVALQRGWPCS